MYVECYYIRQIRQPHWPTTHASHRTGREPGLYDRGQSTFGVLVVITVSAEAVGEVIRDVANTHVCDKEACY